ncbi:hypothetical protein EC988_004567 [Linderina pennispora]|nr:hypothetical protein EC988_004567 [Linderina pennispora]
MPVRITVQIDGHQPTVRFYSTGPFDPAIMQLKALKIRLVHSCRVCMAFGWFACAWHYAPVSQEVVEDIVGFIQHVPTLEVIEAEPVLCEQLARHPLRRIRLRAGE